MEARIKTRQFLAAAVLMTLPAVLTADQADVLPLGTARPRFAVATLEAGRIMETASGAAVTIDDIVARNIDRDVFIIGELHDSYACHEFQRDLIEALAARHPKLVVGFEFFQRQDDETLELWRTGKISERELLERTGWYDRSAQNYGFTRLVMDVVRKQQLKTVGLNVPRELIHKVSTKGLASLSEEEKALFPGVAAPNLEHEFYIRTIFGDQSALMPDWFNRMYEAQKCWDSVMAGSMRRVLARKEYRGYKGVIIAGAGHVAYGLGIPFRYALSDKMARLLTVVPVMAPSAAELKHAGNAPMGMTGMGKEEPPSAVFSRGIADYVLSVAPSDRDYFPSFGLSGRISDAGEFEVTAVQKGGLAEKSGLAGGDVILSIDGVKINSVAGFRLLLSEKRWDDSVVFELKKSVKLKK